ncbi:unnamed protein product [Amaranthus hypochondriacus]
MAAVRSQDTDLYMLMDDKQLRKLATLLRNQEEPLMMSIKSEPDRIKFLTECNDVYDITVKIIDISAELRKKHETSRSVDSLKADIAVNLQEYVKYGVNMSMQCIRNCGMRLLAVEKLKAHFNDLADELNKVDSRIDSDGIQSLAQEVGFYKQAMLEYANNFQSGSARAHSREYSMALKLEGIQFPNLVDRHKNRLGYKEEFEFLEDEQKLEVYNSIINESGRANLPKVYKRKANPGAQAGGIAVLAMSASMMAWDIFTAEHKLEAVLNSAISVLADIGAFAVQVAVSSAVSTAVANVTTGVFLVSLAGFIAGAVAGILFAAAAGALIDLILGSGGKEAPNLDNLKFYTGTMPDGMALANELSHYE